MNVALSMLCAALVLMFVPGTEQPANAGRIALILVGTPALWLLVARRRTARPAPAVGAIAAIVLGAALVGLLLVPAAERIAAAFDLTIIAALLGLAWLGSTFEEEQIDAIAVGVAWGIAIAAPLGLTQAWLGWDAPFFAQARPPAGTFVNRNVAAEAMVVTVPLALWAGLRGKSQTALWGGILGAACGAAFLIATRSRSGWGAAAIGWGVMMVMAWWGAHPLTRRRIAGPSLAAIGVIVIALFIPVHGTQPLPSVATTLSLSARPLEGSGAVRLALARNTLAMIGDRVLFGVGAGRWSTLYPLYHQRVAADPLFSLERQPERVENDWLEFAADLGVPAAVALAVLIVGGAWRASRARRYALAASLIAVTLHACLAFPLHSPASAGLSMLIAGAAWSTNSTSRVRAGVAVSRIPAAMLVAALLAVGGSVLGCRVIAGQRQVYVAVMSADCLARSAAALNVASLTPWARRDIGLTAAAVFQCERDPARSLALIEPALAVNPHNLNLLLLAAARQLRGGAPERADGLARRALEVEPQLGRAWLLLAMAQDAQGDATGAVASCENAVRWYGDAPEARTYCGGRPR